MNCFACGHTGFKIRMEVRGTPYKLLQCIKCDVTFAHTNTENIFEYTDYGGYLVEAAPSDSKREYEKNYARIMNSLVSEYGSNCVLLDIGAGCGLFVKFCGEKGITAIGIEPSVKLREYAANKLDIHLRDSIEHIDDNSVDIVSCLDVIEHIPPENQQVFLAHIYRVLKKGGVLLGNTPNIDSLNIWLAKDKDPVIWPPSHLVYFSPKTLDRHLTRQNFTKRYCFTKGFAPFRMYKNVKSFVDVPHGALASLIAFPLKVFNKLIGMGLSVTNFGHQIYFCYGK